MLRSEGWIHRTVANSAYEGGATGHPLVWMPAGGTALPAGRLPGRC